MKDPDGRLLTLALRELLEDASPFDRDADDFVRRVRETWARREAETHVEGASRRRRGKRAEGAAEPRRIPRWAFVATAAAVAVMAGIASWLLANGEDRNRASHTEPTQARAERSTQQGSQRLAAGSSLPLGSEGAGVAALAPSLVELDEDGGLRVRDGRLEAVAGEDPLDLGLPGGARVTLEPRAALVVHVRRVEPVDGLPHDDDASGVLELALRRGAARIDGELLAPVDAATLSQPWLALFDRGQLRTARASDRSIPERLRELGDSTREPQRQSELMSIELEYGVLARLREEPALWALAEVAVAEGLGLGLDDGRAPDGMRSLWVDAIAVDQSPVALRLARRAWREDPALFDGESITAFAERGVPEFEREVLAWFDDRDARAGDAREVERSAPIAALLAMSGDARGEAVLRAVVAPDETGRPSNARSAEYLRAAAALSRLGDGRYLERVLMAHAGGAREALERGDRERASRSIDLLAYGLALRDGRSPLEGVADDVPAWLEQPRVGEIATLVLLHHALRDEQRALEGAESLEDELARLARR